MRIYKEHLINIGSGIEKSIYEFAQFILNLLKINLRIKFDKSKPDGTPRKLLDTSRINNLGWHPKIKLSTGISDTYEWFQSQLTSEGSLRL